MSFEPKGKRFVKDHWFTVVLGAILFGVGAQCLPTEDCRKACGTAQPVVEVGQCYCDETKRVPAGMEGRRSCTHVLRRRLCPSQWVRGGKRPRSPATKPSIAACRPRRGATALGRVPGYFWGAANRHGTTRNGR